MDDKLTKQVERLLLNAALKTDEKSRNYISTSASAAGYDNAEVPDLIADDPEDWELANEHADYLIKLSQQLTQKETQDLDSMLLSRIGDRFRKQIVDACTLYFVHSAKIDILIEHMRKSFTGYMNNEGLQRGIKCLRESMRHRPDLFSENITEQIYSWCEDCLYGDSKLAQDIKEYRSLYSDMVKELTWLRNLANEILTKSFLLQIDSAFNPELNTDEQKVVEEIESLGLPLDLTESLRHIDSLIENANTPMKYRDAMSAIRAFTERFYEQIAKALDPKTKVDGKDSKVASKFFHEKKLLSQDMADLLVAHRHFLSNDGTHRIKSRKEDARIAKNITIELSLYIITRLREMGMPPENQQS